MKLLSYGPEPYASANSAIPASFEQIIFYTIRSQKSIGIFQIFQKVLKIAVKQIPIAEIAVIRASGSVPTTSVCCAARRILNQRRLRRDTVAVSTVIAEQGLYLRHICLHKGILVEL